MEGEREGEVERGREKWRGEAGSNKRRRRISKGRREEEGRNGSSWEPETIYHSLQLRVALTTRG